MTSQEISKWFQEINSELGITAKKSQVDYYNKVIPGSKPSLGVKVPILRKMAKEIAKKDYKSFMEHYECEYYEQEMLKAFAIGYARDDIEVILEYAEQFVPTIHDWAVNDAFCQNFSIARKNREIVFKWVLKYVESRAEFEQRVVAVLLMSHFLVDEYYEQVLSIMERLDNPAYYTKMGVAWCVATVYAKYPKATMQFLKKGKLDDWTYNKSIQKMIESYRVSDEDKVVLRSMKRK